MKKRKIIGFVTGSMLIMILSFMHTTASESQAILQIYASLSARNSIHPIANKEVAKLTIEEHTEELKGMDSVREYKGKRELNINSANDSGLIGDVNRFAYMAIDKLWNEYSGSELLDDPLAIMAFNLIEYHSETWNGVFCRPVPKGVVSEMNVLTDFVGFFRDENDKAAYKSRSSYRGPYQLSTSHGSGHGKDASWLVGVINQPGFTEPAITQSIDGVNNRYNWVTASHRAVYASDYHLGLLKKNYPDITKPDPASLVVLLALSHNVGQAVVFGGTKENTNPTNHPFKSYDAIVKFACDYLPTDTELWNRIDEKVDQDIQAFRTNGTHLNMTAGIGFKLFAEVHLDNNYHPKGDFKNYGADVNFESGVYLSGYNKGTEVIGYMIQALYFYSALSKLYYEGA